jgi:4-hydroxy-tetrahydrodipicolinate synthase
LVVLGTTGESATLSKEEKKEVIQTIIKTNNNRLPLVLGIGGNNTQTVIEEIENTNLDDFCAILSVSPYYNKPSQKGIIKHYQAIAGSTEKPIILYNVPSRTGKNVEPETILKIANKCENIVAVKDAAGDMNQTLYLLQNKPKDFLVISGEDALALPSTIAGGAGVISVLGQGMPKEFSEMIQLGLKKDAINSFNSHYKLMNLANLIFEEGNPTGIKSILKLKEISTNNVRLPLVKASKKLTNTIKKELTKF